MDIKHTDLLSIVCSYTRKHQVPIILFLVLIFPLLDVIRFSNNPLSNYYSSLYYFIGYDTGFGGRKLIGTICSFILPNYVTMHNIRIILLFINILMLALFFVFVNMAFRWNSHSPFTSILLILYAVLPFSIMRWCSIGLSVAFMETYMFVLTLIWLLLFCKAKRNWFYYTMTLILSVLGLLIHVTFCCTFLPLFIALFIYDCFENERFNTKRAITYGIICFILFLLFLSLWFYGKMTVDIESLIDYIRKRTNHEVCTTNKEIIDWLYYRTNMENRQLAFADSKQIYQVLLISIILLLPLFACFYAPMYMAFKRSANRTTKYKYVLMPVALTAMTIPVFFMATDYGRWFTVWFFCCFAMLCVAIYKKDVLIVNSLSRMYSNHWFVAFLIIYASQLHMVSFAGLQEAIILRPHLFP